MARWEPNARERLERAALALFAERGYDATTVAEIAEHAGLTKSTFFRHFADKREVVVDGKDLLANLFRDTINASPPTATAIDCIAAALESAAAVALIPDRHDLATQRSAVVAASSELQERELLKLARLSDTIAEAFRARGIDDTTARLAAEAGVLAFTIAYNRWAPSENRQPFAEIAHTVLHELQASAKILGTN